MRAFFLYDFLLGPVNGKCKIYQISLDVSQIAKNEYLSTLILMLIRQQKSLALFIFQGIILMRNYIDYA